MPKSAHHSMAKQKKTSFNKKTQKQRKKKDSAGSAFLTVIIIALLTVAVGIYLLAKYGEKIPSYLIPKRTGQGVKIVNLYFSNEEGVELIGEKRKIERGTLTKEIKEAVNGIIKGPEENLTPTIPDGTRLLNVEVKDGVAFLNFSKEISENHPGGSSAEIQTIYSVINTITLNFPEIKMVQFLIEGEKAKTLAGHIDISSPLGPSAKFIKG